MAAAATDKFRKTARRWVGTIGAGGVSDAVVTTVPLSSSTNLPTDTGVTVVIDRVDANGVSTASKEETVTGVVSGNNLISCVRGVEGTAQAHDAGAVVELLFSNKLWNDFIDGVMAEHQQDGTHGTLAAPVFTSPEINTSITGTALLDEDDMASNSAVKVASQQSIKAYVDSGTATLTNKTIVQKVTSYTPDAAGTATLNLTTGNIHAITMPAGNITIAISNEAVGQCFLIEITQDGGGSRTVTWFSTIKWSGGSAPTLTTTASKRDVFGFRVTGTDTYDGFIVGQNV